MTGVLPLQSVYYAVVSTGFVASSWMHSHSWGAATESFIVSSYIKKEELGARLLEYQTDRSENEASYPILQTIGFRFCSNW